MRNFFTRVLALMTLLAAIMLSGCAKPPEAEKAAAKSAMDTAVTAEALRYATSDFDRAKKIWDSAEARLKEKQYGEAKKGYIEAKAGFEKAAEAVPAGKKAVVGEVNADELKRALALVEEDWKNLQTLYRKVEAKLEKKKLWENDAKTFTENLKTAKSQLDTDPVSAKLKIDSLRPIIVSYTVLFKELEGIRKKR